MKVLKILSVLLLLTSQPSIAQESITDQVECACRDGIGARKGDKPTRTFSLKNGTKLIVCGYEDYDIPTVDFPIYSEFDIYNCTNGEKLTTYGALSVCDIKLNADKSALVITAMKSFTPSLSAEKWKYIPFYEERITSDNGNIKSEGTKVIFDISGYKNKKDIAAFKKQVRSLKGVGEKLGRMTDDGTYGTAYKLMFCAMAGDTFCRKVFTDFESYFNYQLDGELAEGYHELEGLLSDYEEQILGFNTCK